MLGIILCGHGGFASGLEQAMLQLVGTQPQFIAIDFPVSSSTALLTYQCKMAMQQVNSGEGVIFLTDLLGGTPFRVAATLALQTPNCEVITGTNLQLLVEMMLERDGLNVVEFCQQAIQSGQRGLTSLSHELAQQRYIATLSEGI